MDVHTYDNVIIWAYVHVHENKRVVGWSITRPPTDPQ